MSVSCVAVQKPQAGEAGTTHCTGGPAAWHKFDLQLLLNMREANLTNCLTITTLLQK